MFFLIFHLAASKFCVLLDSENVDLVNAQWEKKEDFDFLALDTRDLSKTSRHRVKHVTVNRLEMREADDVEIKGSSK